MGIRKDMVVKMSMKKEVQQEAQVQPAKEQSPKGKVKKKWSWKRFGRACWETGKMLVVIAVFAGAGVWYALGENASEPKKVAEEYFSALLTGSSDKMYGLLDIEESAFVNEKFFQNYVESEKIYGSVLDCEYKAPKKLSDDLISIEVEYKLAATQEGEEEQTDIYEIHLKKQKEKVYLLFPVWKIDLEEKIIKNCHFSAPAKVGAYVDEVKLDDYLDEDKSNQDMEKEADIKYYTIPRMLAGDHVFSAYDAYTEKANLAVNIQKDEESYHIGREQVTMPQVWQKDIIKQSRELLLQMFGNAMDHTKKYNSVKTLFASDAKSQAIGKKCFDTLKRDVVKEDGTVLSKLDFDNIMPYIAYYEYPDQAVVQINYKFQYNAKKGDVFISGFFDENKGKGEDKAKVTFHLRKNKWVVTDIDLTCFPYEATVEE